MAIFTVFMLLFRGMLSQLGLSELAWMLRQRRIRVSRRLKEILVKALVLFLSVLVTDSFLNVALSVLGVGKSLSSVLRNARPCEANQLIVS